MFEELIDSLSEAEGIEWIFPGPKVAFDGERRAFAAKLVV